MITRNQIKYIRLLHLKKNRDMHNCFVVEGEKIVAELLKSDFNVKAIFATKNWEQSAENTIQVNIVSEKDLKRISALKSPNKVVAITEIPQKKFDILIITFINFLMFFFPLKSSGSFFTTSNSTFMIITLVILLSQLQKIDFKKKLLKYF